MTAQHISLIFDKMLSPGGKLFDVYQASQQASMTLFLFA
jgi:hypothetical protein